MGELIRFPKRCGSTAVSPRDYQASKRVTFVQGYCGYKRYEKFAWFPVHTEDMGWVWGRRYFVFWTNTGYDKHGWAWRCHGAAVTLSKMEQIQARTLREIAQ